MKLLILSTATGQGHNSASRAVGEYLDTLGCETVLMDVLKSGKKNVSSRVSGLYSGITVHAPWLFGLLYHAGELVSSSSRRSPIYYLNSLYAPGLYRKILAVSPDVIVCPHIFSAQVITFIREKYGMRIPTAGIITDYTCSPFWEETRLDRYIIPARELREEFVKKGIPAKKLVPIGIPVSSRFARSTDRAEARKRFGFTAEHVFAVMGGSMGFGNMRAIAAAILRRMPEAQVAVVCGKNKKLAQQLRRMVNVTAFEYIDNVDILMDAADVLLTKPGGLSSTEALVKRVPIVFTCPIPGGEVRNAERISSLGMASYAGSVEKAADEAVRLASDGNAARRMIEAQQRHIGRDTAKRAGDFLLGMAAGAKGETV